jgi:hypothetical protein
MFSSSWFHSPLFYSLLGMERWYLQKLLLVPVHLDHNIESDCSSYSYNGLTS